MDLCNPGTRASRRVLTRVASLVREVVQEDGHMGSPLVKTNRSVERVLAGRNHYVATLVGVAAALGYDVVIHFRRRRR
jgi:hypothetical protein